MYPARMTLTRAAIVVSMICLVVSCGGSDNGGTGGSGGSGGGTAGATGTAGASGAAGAAGGGAGANGTGTGGGGGVPANCAGCVACAMANCASAITTCQANTTCNALYQCVHGCTMSTNACIQMNPDAIVSGAAVLTCINQNCLSQCQN